MSELEPMETGKIRLSRSWPFVAVETVEKTWQSHLRDGVLLSLVSLAVFFTPQLDILSLFAAFLAGGAVTNAATYKNLSEGGDGDA